MKIHWVLCEGDRYCSLEGVNLDSVRTEGVYVIWHSITGRVVYVGQGNIAQRLTEHKKNPEVLQHRTNGQLLVTWASVDASDRDGVESYLWDKFDPLEGNRRPLAKPVDVNVPSQ